MDKCAPIPEAFQGGEELQFARAEGVLDLLQKQAAEQQRQHANLQ
jgi:hypothetical protein